MKKFAFIALLMIGSAAFARTETSGVATVVDYDAPDQTNVTIYGPAAEKLYKLLSSVKESEMATGSEGATWKYRKGKNLRCDKIEQKGKSTQYQCETGLLNADGSISTPAEG